MGMFDFLGSFGSPAADEVAKGAGTGLLGWLSNGENLKGIGSILGGAGNAWAGIDQSKQAKALLNLQKSAYEDEKKRRDAAQLAIDGINWNTTPSTTPRLPLGGA